MMCPGKLTSWIKNSTTHLHTNNCINEEQYADKQRYVWKCLERASESP